MRFDLDSALSLLSTTGAAQIFWTIFAVGAIVSFVLMSRMGSHEPRRWPRARTRIFDLPPSAQQPIPHAELIASRRPRRTESIVVDEMPPPADRA